MSPRSALWIAALSAFAVSALHLSQVHRGGTSWPVELLGHHASVPLAFAILYQDYPFALADLFLKRALRLLAIVSVTFAAIGTLGRRSALIDELIEREPRQVGVIVTVCVAIALLAGIIWADEDSARRLFQSVRAFCAPIKGRARY